MFFSAYADTHDDAVWLHDHMRTIEANCQVHVQRVDIMPSHIRTAVENTMPQPPIYPTIQLVQPTNGPDFIQGREAILRSSQTEGLPSQT